MAKINGIYKCEICGNIVSVIEGGDGALVCCGEEMKLFEEKRSGEGMEKHLPVISGESNKVIVKVGSAEHPMEESHYIQLIQLLNSKGIIAEKRLMPGEKPEAEFIVKDRENIIARALCNVHGLWATEQI